MRDNQLNSGDRLMLVAIGLAIVFWSVALVYAFF
jgi:hypothetical protein